MAARRAELPGRIAEPAGGTVCVCAVDRDGMAVSLLQSLYDAFGSGVVAGSSGIVLNNRAAGFAVQGAVAGGTRPYHTLIPGMLTRGSELIGPFGLMGGFIQAQSHVQFLAALLPDGDPQVALDRGRFRIDGSIVRLEQPLWDRADELESLGFQVARETERSAFGGGQAIIRARRDAVRRLGRPQGRLRARDLKLHKPTVGAPRFGRVDLRTTIVPDGRARPRAPGDALCMSGPTHYTTHCRCRPVRLPASAGRARR